MDNTLANRAADNIRILSAAMVEKANSGHPGGAMGGADFVNILFSEYLNFDPSDKNWHMRDRFFLDPGHMSPMLYSILTLCGNYSVEDLKNFRQWGSCTPGHPERDLDRAVENTSGPLGQGHAMAVGAAIAERFLCARFGEWMSHKTYAYISDGGVQEEISQGAGRIAGHLGLSNLIMFYDSNDIQLSTETAEVTSEDVAMKYEAWGWRVTTIDGNDADQIREAMTEAIAEKEKPFLIIGKTTMAKGAIGAKGESYEFTISTHGQPLTHAGASFENTIKNLGGDPKDPFQIFEDVQAEYTTILEAKLKYATRKKKRERDWAAKNPELGEKLETFLSGSTLDGLDFSTVTSKPNVATRQASADVLSYLAKSVPNMIVASADLANSDKTDAFLKNTTPLEPGNFEGAFLHAGVSELTMAAICNGIALHGGCTVACATFFVFSDYMKPAVRLSALMGLPVKYIWTHDAFRVGEDGPTHQPVEHEAQIRLMESLKNHHGQNSMLVLRPADSAETVVAWKMAIENTKTPTGLIFSRQNINDLPKLSKKRYTDALAAEKGAYIVIKPEGTPDVVLVASGSEVSTLCEASVKLISEKNLKVQVVSAPSEGLFYNQSPDYRAAVLPAGIPTFGLTAGLPLTLRGLVGANGEVWGLGSFGQSAPASVLDQKFGFTAENVYIQVINLLKRQGKL